MVCGAVWGAVALPAGSPAVSNARPDRYSRVPLEVVYAGRNLYVNLRGGTDDGNEQRFPAEPHKGARLEMLCYAPPEKHQPASM